MIHATSRPVMQSYYSADRLSALRRFAFFQTVVTILGHVWWGFEGAYAMPLVAMAASYLTQIGLGTLVAFSNNEKPWFMKDFRSFIDFLLPAHIVALTCSMFIFPGDRLIGPIVFTVLIAIASKYLINYATYDSEGNQTGRKHIFNPANLGILSALVLFKDISIVLPYGFSAYTNDVVDIGLPVVVFGLGTMINAKFTKRLPLICALTSASTAQISSAVTA